MTTVGYGDHVPRTFPGMLVGCLAMLSGIVLISLPVAIVGSKFQLAYEQKEEQETAERLLAFEEEQRENGGPDGKAVSADGDVARAVSSGTLQPQKPRRRGGMAGALAARAGQNVQGPEEVQAPL